MSLAEYIDGLTKWGVLDGLRADAIIAKHKAECANPILPLRQKIAPLLEAAWAKRDGNPEMAGLADAIDDILTVEET